MCDHNTTIIVHNELPSRNQFERCAGRHVNLRGFSCSRTIAPMAVLSNVQMPSSSYYSDSQVPSILYNQRQELSERNCPSSSMAKVFLKVATSFFRNREQSSTFFRKGGS